MAVEQEEAALKADETSGAQECVPWVCAEGADLVNRTERLICAEGASTSSAAAQGMALAGRPSACLLPNSTAEVAAFPAHPGSCVYHAWAEDPLPAAASVVLSASSHQEAVDHCLAAHLIARRSCAAVFCLIHRTLGEQPGLVHLPSSEQISAALDGESASGGQHALGRAALDAFELVEELTGRCCGPLTCQGAKAEAVIVTAGSPADAARAAAEAFQGSPTAADVISVNQIRPFPKEALLEALLGYRRAFLLTVPGQAIHTTLRAGLELLARKHPSGFPQCTPIPLPAAGLNCRQLVQSLERSCPQMGWSAALLDRMDGGNPSRPPLRLGATPGGSWSERLLLDTAAAIAAAQAGKRPVPLQGELEGVPTLRVGWISKSGLSMAALRLAWDPLGGSSDGADDQELDVLLVTENHFVNPEPALMRLRRQGKLLLFGSAAEPARAWRLLPASRRRGILKKEIQPAWLSSSTFTAVQESAIQRFLQGALLRLSCATEDARQLPGLPCQEADWLRQGAEQLDLLQPADLEDSLARQELDFRSSDQPLRMPPAAPSDSEGCDAWKPVLRSFHVSGQGARSPQDPLPGLPLWPAVADVWPEDGWRRCFPLYLEEQSNDDQSARATPLAELLREAVEAQQKSGSPFALLHDHLESLLDEAAAQVGQVSAAPFAQVIKAALQKYSSRFELSQEGSQELEKELAQLGRSLPQTGWLAGFGEQALLALYAWSAAAQRRPHSQAMQREVRRLVRGLEDLLLSDRSQRPESSLPDSLSASIGEGSAYIDAEALSGVLPSTRGAKPMEEGRQRRIEELLTTLRGHLEFDGPPFYLIGSADVPGGFSSPPGLEVPPLTPHWDAFGAAIGLFDGVMARASEVFRAVRMARLEVDGNYDPALHDEAFARFDWQSLSAEELLAVPPVVVLESAQRLTGTPLASLGRLLRSGCPIQVLIADADPLMRFDPTDEDLTGYWPDFGYLAVAHREAFVLQSSLIEPQHLADGLQTLAAELRPSVALVAVPHLENAAEPFSAEVLDWAWRLSRMAQAGRITPCFRYSPQAGESWAERFNLDANPQPEKLHPEVSSQFAVGGWQSGTGSDAEKSPSEPRTEIELRTQLTFAHAAALNPKYRQHFRVIPVEAWDDAEQMEIADYLESYAETPPAAVPYIWVHDQRGVLQRAVMTREMAVACRDRRRFWRILQELAGVNNEYVRRAVESVRQEVTAQAEARLQEEIEQARRAGAEEAIDRLVAALTRPELLAGQLEQAAPSPAAPPVEKAPPPAIEEKEEKEAAQEEAPAEKPPPTADEYEEPYIDSFLCTSCNDCIKLNPLLFIYNSDKQAEIGDPSAGSYAELVKAAEVCPARCIHPGRPRPDDDSATPDIVARAEPFK